MILRLLAICTLAAAKELWEYDKEFTAEKSESKLKETHYKDNKFTLDEASLEEAQDKLDFLLVMFRSDTDTGAANLQEQNTGLLDEASKILAKEGTEHVIAMVDGQSILDYYHVNKGQFGFFKRATPDATELTYEQYSGDPYSGEGLAQMVRRMLRPSICDVLDGESDVADFIKANGKAAAVGFYQASTELVSPSDMESFTKHVEIQLIDAPNVPCGLTEDEDAAKKYGFDGPGLAVFVEGEQSSMPTAQFLESIGHQKIVDNQISGFVHRKTRPTVLTLDSDDTYELYWDRSAAHLMFFGTKDEGSGYAEFEAAAKTVQEQHTDIVPVFVDMNTHENEAFRRFWVLKPHTTSGHVRLYKRKGRGEYYHFMMKTDMSAKNVQVFTKQFFAGNLIPIDAPQPSALPYPGWDKGDGALTKYITRYDLEHYASQKKDVVMVFFSPSCMHCKRFLPVFEELAKAVDGQDTITFGSVDLKGNHITGTPVESLIRGVPTIVIFPAYADKAKPIKWEHRGEKSKEALIAWLDKTADMKFTVDGQAVGQGKANPEGYKSEISDDEFDEL